MTRRPGRELEQLPHHVYIHFNKKGAVIYVGRTVDPDSRPWDASRRKWMKTESDEVLVSPAMPFEAAMWMETTLIRTSRPRHNRQVGQYERPALDDWRIDRLCEAEGVTRATAKWAVDYMPSDPDEFEAFLTHRAANAGTTVPEAMERAFAGIDLEPMSGRSAANLRRGKAAS